MVLVQRLRTTPSQIGRMRYWLKQLRLNRVDAQIVLAWQLQGGSTSTAMPSLATRP